MKCELCINSSMYICPCNSIYLCPFHLGVHLQNEGSHAFEKLVDLSLEENEGLRREIIRLITEIEKKKFKVYKEMKKLIIFVEKSAKSACEGIDKVLKSFLKFSSLDSFYQNQKEEIEIIIENCIQLNDSVIPELELTLMNFYKNELTRQSAAIENNTCQECQNQAVLMEQKIKDLESSLEEYHNREKEIIKAPKFINKDENSSFNDINSQFENKIALLEHKIKYLENTLEESRKREKEYLNESRLIKKDRSSTLIDIQKRFETQIKNLQSRLDSETERANKLERNIEEKEIQYENDCQRLKEKESKLNESLLQSLKSAENEKKNQEKMKIKELETNISKLTFELEKTLKTLKSTEFSKNSEFRILNQENTILTQKLEFANQEVLDLKLRLENERKQNSNVMNSLNFSSGIPNRDSETQLSAVKSKYTEQIKLLELELNLKTNENHDQVKALTKRNCELELEIKSQVSDWEDKYNILNRDYIEANEERIKLKKILTEARDNHKSEFKDFETQLKKKVMTLENIIDEMKINHSKEIQNAKISEESSLLQLKEIFEQEKNRLEAKCNDDKTRADKRYNLMVEDYEERLKNKCDKYECDKYEEDLREMELYFNEKIKSLNHKAALDNQKIEILIKLNEDNKDQIKIMQKTIENLNMIR